MLQLSQHGHRTLGVGADPAFVDGVDRQWVEVVPTLPAPPLDDDEVGAFQRLQMLHHGAAIEFGKLGAERPGGQRLVAQNVEDRSAMMRCEGAENPVLPLADGTWQKI